MAKAIRAWSGSEWVLLSTGTSGGGSASGTPFNIPSTLVARSASGSFQIGSVDFHTASPVSSAIGRMTWDSGDGTVSLGLTGGNVNLKVGQEEIALCYNGTGSIIPKGRVVYISGAQGQRPSISLSNALTEPTSSKTFGLTAEAISDGAEGFVATFGVIENVNTSEFTEGAALWLSSSSGLITETKPTAPVHLVFIGYCLKSHASSGRIFINPQNGYELQELHNVLITSASQTHILTYNSASSLWQNKGLLEAIKELDGSGSGIDADLLDGQHGLYYQDSAGASATYLKQSDAASAYIRVTSSASIVENYIPVSSSYAYLTRSDAELTYIPITASSEYLTESEAAALYIPISASSGTFDADKLDGFDSSYFLNWANITNKPDPLIGIELTGDVTGAASVTLTDLGNGQISITTTSEGGGGGGGTNYQSASPTSPSIGDIWVDSDNDIPGVNLNDYALKNSPHFYGITSFSDGQTIDGQIIAASSVFYIKAGTSNIDPSGIIVITRHSTIDQFIDQFNVYANTSNFKGYITALDPLSSSHVTTKNYVDSIPHPFLLGGM